MCSWIDFPNNFCISSWTVFQCVNTQTPHKSSQPASTHSLAQLCCGLLATSSVIITYWQVSLAPSIACHWFQGQVSSQVSDVGLNLSLPYPFLPPTCQGGWKYDLREIKHQAYAGRECAVTHDSTYSAILPHFTLFPSVWMPQRPHLPQTHSWDMRLSRLPVSQLLHSNKGCQVEWGKQVLFWAAQQSMLHRLKCCKVSFQPKHAWCKARLPSSLTTISFYSCHQKTFKREKLQCFWGWNGIIVYINFNGGKLLWFVKI